jgi:uncharacterized protein (TIRG00374 family)
MVGLSGIRTTLIVFALFLLCVGLALWGMRGEDLFGHLGAIDAAGIAVLLALSLINYILRAVRWSLYLSTLRLAHRFLKAVLDYVAGFAMTLTPARLGELVRLRWAARETGAGYDTLAPMVLVDRAGDLASTGLLLAIAMAFSAGGVAGGLPVAGLALIVALVATRPVLFTALVDLLYRIVGRKARLFVRARRAARALAPFSAINVAGPAIGLGMVGWFAEGYSFYLLLGMMGAEVSLWTAVAIFLFSMLTGGATGMPGGVGGAEAAMVALLALQGVPIEISVPATAIIRLTTLWFAVGVGMLAFPFAEGLAGRRDHALERG